MAGVTPIRTRLAAWIDIDGQRQPGWIPRPARRMLRRVTGGSDWTAQVARGLLWKFRFLVVGSLVANLAAAVFEGSTMAVLIVALETVESGSLTTTSALPGFLTDLAAGVQAAAGPSGVFLVLVIMAVILQLLRSGFEYAGRSLSITIRAWIEGDLRRRLFTQLVSIGYPQISRYKIGGLAAFNEQVNNIGILIQNGNQALSDGAVILAYAVVLLWISWQMTLLAVAALVLVTFGLRRVRASIRTISTHYMASSVAINERFVEYLQNIRLLHVFSRESFAVSEVEEVINQSVRARRRGLQRAAVVPLLMQSATIIGAALFLIAGYVLIERYGRGSYAGLVTFVFILYRLMPRIASLNRSVGLISNEWPFAERIAGMLRTDDKEYEHSGRVPFLGLASAIEFSDVSLRYAGADRSSLDDISLTIPAGSMVAFVGPSGSGKTSIVNLLLRLYDPTDGRILADGKDIREFVLSSWRDRIGVVDQETYLFNASVMQNIRFGRLGRQRRKGCRGRRHRQCPRLHSRPATRLRHRNWRPRPPAVRGPAPTHRHRPRRPARPGYPHLRRSH